MRTYICGSTFSRIKCSALKCISEIHSHEIYYDRIYYQLKKFWIITFIFFKTTLPSRIFLRILRSKTRACVVSTEFLLHFWDERCCILFKEFFNTDMAFTQVLTRIIKKYFFFLLLQLIPQRVQNYFLMYFLQM